MPERRVSDTGQRPSGGDSVNVTVERTGEGTVYRAEPRHLVTDYAAIERTAMAVPARDRIRWGPILAGLVTTLASMLVLTVLGLALGLSVFEPTSDGSDVGVAAAIWSALSALASFFLGGWVAGKTAAVHGDDNALLNGFMVGATALALILWLTSTGVGNLLGGLGANISDIARIGADQVSNADIGAATESAGTAAVAAYDEARNSAWGTLAGLLLSLGAATVGGMVGHKARHSHNAYERDHRRDDAVHVGH